MSVKQATDFDIATAINHVSQKEVSQDQLSDLVGSQTGKTAANSWKQREVYERILKSIVELPKSRR